MISSMFVDTCYTVLLNNNNQLKKSQTFYTDLIEILNFYKNNYEIPIILKSKIDCIYQLCNLFIEGKNLETIIDSVSMTPKYQDLLDYIESKLNNELTLTQLNNCIKQVRLRKKYIYMVKNHQKILNILNSIDEGSYDCIDEIITNYESLIKELYLNIITSNRIIEIESASSIDIMTDDYEPLIEKIKEKYDPKNRVPTGIDVFDSKIFFGGVEKTRLYIFAGGSGAGKSTLLDNIMINSAIKQCKFDIQNNYTKNRVYLLITLENQIDETFMRMYQSLFNKTVEEFIHDINKYGPNEIRQNVIDKISSKNIKFIIKYFQAKSISPMDIDSVISEVSSMYGKDSITMVGVDYLDLMKGDISREIIRHELGEITLSLKTIAVDHSVPLLTVTQLNREVYKVSSAEDLKLSMMGESMQKVHHADYISLQAQNLQDSNTIHFAVGKNRSGINNIVFDFKADLSRYKFLNAIFNNNTNNQNKTKQTHTGHHPKGVTKPIPVSNNVKIIPNTMLDPLTI